MTTSPKRSSVSLNQSSVTDTPSVPLKKRRLNELNTSDTTDASGDVGRFCPQQMHLVSVLRNDVRSKCIVLHTRFENSSDKESIVILQKSSFPNDPKALQSAKVVNRVLSESEIPSTDVSNGPDPLSEQFPLWKSESILTNDVYHRLLVTAGLEPVNSIDMTIIHPAEPHHFKRYTSSGRRVFEESADVYQTVIVPFLAEKPRDLAWVDNILAGTAEQDRILFQDNDPTSGFSLVLDYRWTGKRIQELHCLGIARDPQLTCFRDLRATHIPMLEHILAEGRKRLCDRYNADHSPGPVYAHQIMAYLHYPPTFYRLHVHFVHVDTGDDAGVRAGRAHLLEEVIRNLQLDGNYYHKGVFTIYLHEGSPMLDALQTAGCLSEPSNAKDDAK